MLTCALASCKGAGVIDTSREDARRRMASGDYGFIISAPLERLPELGALGDEAYYFASLHVRASGAADALDRERRLLALAADSKNAVLRQVVHERIAVLDKNEQLRLSLLSEDTIERGVALVDRRSYDEAYELLGAAVKENPEAFLADQTLIPALGRAWQYGGDTREGAKLFSDWALSLVSTSEDSDYQLARYYLLFFAGRMYRQQGSTSSAKAVFLDALPLAPDEEQEGACLWYIVDCALDIGLDAAMNELPLFAKVWNNPSQFESLLDRMSSLAISKGRWELLPRMYQQLSPWMDASTVARLAYLCARLLELDYISVDEFSVLAKEDDAEAIIRWLFRIAFEADSASFYYRTLAAIHLGQNVDPIPAEARRNSLELLEGTLPGALATNGPQISRPESATLLAFYMDFFEYGSAKFLLSHVYARLEDIESADLIKLARQYSDERRWADAIRLISRLASRPGWLMDRDAMKLLYPVPYTVEVDEAAELWSLRPALIYALLRTESAFIQDVHSHAGAVGLAQLMPATALDIYGRIRRYVNVAMDGDKPDIYDARTNVLLGSWYLSDQRKRLNSTVLALVAYNGGPARVRRWRAEQPALPEDLFLESVPYSETRNYGRKVLAASAVYGYLYFDNSLESVIREVFPDIFGHF